MDDFADKVTLITGAGRGIGREIALQFARMGAALAVNDINPVNLDETLNQIVLAGGTARAYVFDIAKRMPVEGMVAKVEENFGRIDILINHATVKPDASLLEMDEWEFHRTLDVNLAGPYFTMQQVGRVMQQQGGGSIVNLISGSAQNHFRKGHTAHAASQAGLLGLTLAAASELSVHHIQVNAVCLGLVISGIIPLASNDLTGFHSWSESYPQLRLGDHPQLVNTVLFLCSQEASSITGQIITFEIDQ
jgi:NAD(P)-dependent dehydrogenase (short-subunit alcohol dehydrogenase family)